MRLYKISGGFVEYDGDRDSDEMKLFVNENTKQKLVKGKKNKKSKKRSKKNKPRSQKKKSRK